jgi:hydroxyethylthiazole kinase-like uncharacterized protein yjeF
MLLLTAAEMREYDRTTIETFKIPGIILMELAGRACAEKALQLLNNRKKTKRVVVVCGAGNNGGDGYVIARHLENAGCSVTTLLFCDRNKIQGDARVHFDALEAMGSDILEVSGLETLRQHLLMLEKTDLLVDAVFGTGLARDITGPIAEMLTLLDLLPCLRLAVDIPSGIDADTGAIRGVALHADATVTFAHYKRGHFLYPGRTFCGELQRADISIPTQLVDALGASCHLLHEESIRPLCKPRTATSYKNTFGHLLILAGSEGKSGAALLCSRASLRSGAGLVTLATPASLRPSLEGRFPELMIEALGQTLSEDSWEEAQPLLANKTALALGPGLGSAAAAFARRAALESTLPMVIDADGLNVFAGALSELQNARGPRILTPHHGEAARLLGVSTLDIGKQRIDAALRLARESRAVVVLKGADSLVASPSGELFVNSSGNPGLAKAGSGDVLTGVIAALLAQGFTTLDAAKAGVYIHGAAADEARKTTGERGMLPSDVIDSLPRVLSPWESPT